MKALEKDLMEQETLDYAREQLDKLILQNTEKNILYQALMSIKFAYELAIKDRDDKIKELQESKT